jgi:cytochrome c553
MKRARLALSCLWLCVPFATLAAGDADAGRTKAEAERCMECHGAEGQGDGQAKVRFAKLAGQRADYLLQQLKSYRSGARRHDVMRLNTQHLDDADLLDLAAYFASRAPMRGEGVGDHAAGRALFMQACSSCHGAAGQGGDAPAPRLAGQDARYLEQQLLDWRSAWRTGAVMNQVAKVLSDAEIRALVAYLSTQAD